MGPGIPISLALRDSGSPIIGVPKTRLHRYTCSVYMVILIYMQCLSTGIHVVAIMVIRPVAARNHYHMNIVTVAQVCYEYHYFLLVAILVGKFLSSTVGFARK